MASESDVSENSSLFESLFTFRDLSVFLPFILGFSTDYPGRDSQDLDQETTNSENSNTHGERVVLINPFTQGMVVIDGTSSLETLFHELDVKNGQPPASKESIDAMTSVEIGQDEDGECVICLEEWEVGGVAKEMPCQHKFHQNCIEKWLRIHGSCPVCRYQMPVGEKEVGKIDEEERGGERRRVGREVWVSFSFRSENTNQAPSDNSSDPSSSPRGDSEVEN
ncbi:E3 ubiquitin-protein ligase MPSR1-like [Prosopis cineraria]|uniref:E3 ubiquitin-protein ligase MPSR1-like n=1 Tax=Prosopis cineraria TaxID=364024 RepID=UPI00241089B2|nr:E3 ubiquitin-protein ligase MPSR1-like [Prosopis cineraria]